MSEEKKLPPLDPQEMEVIKNAKETYGWGVNLPLMQRMVFTIEALEAELAEAKAALATVDNSETWMCPECGSIDTDELFYHDDFGSRKCLNCGYEGSPGEDFPLANALLKRIAALEAELAEANNLIDGLREQRRVADELHGKRTDELAEAEARTEELHKALRRLDWIVVHGNEPDGNEPEWICQMVERFVHDRRRLAAAERLAELVKRASTDSCTTTGEQGGPGCFYCDIEDGHTDDCEAVEALRAFEETKDA